MISLVENIKFQLASVAVLFFVVASWVFIFAQHGLTLNVPVIGQSQSTLVGFVLNNFAFVRQPLLSKFRMTGVSWKHPDIQSLISLNIRE